MASWLDRWALRRLGGRGFLRPPGAFYSRAPGTVPTKDNGRPADPIEDLKYPEWSNGVYACSNLRAKMLSGVPLKLYTLAPTDGKRAFTPGKRIAAPSAVRGVHLTGTEEVQEVTSGPLYDLLQFVNPEWTMRGLIYLTEMSLCLSGQSFWRLERGEDGTAMPYEIWYTQHTRMTLVPPARGKEIEPGRSALVGEWVVDKNRATEKHLQPEEVVWVRYPDPSDPDYGALSPLFSARLAADSYRAAMQANKNIFENGLNNAGVLVPPNEQEFYTPEQMQELSRDLDRRFRGVDKAHRVGVMSHRFEFKDMGMTPADAEFMQLLDFTIEDIGRAYGVPIEFIGGARRTYQNLENAQRAIWTQTLVPEAAFLADELTERLLAKVTDEPLFFAFDLSEVEALQESANDEWQRSAGQLGAGVITKREWRVANGYEPFEEMDEETNEGTKESDEAGQMVPSMEQPGSDDIETTKDIALNGAQVQSLLEIIQTIGDGPGQIPKATAKALIMTAFAVSGERADEILAAIPESGTGSSETSAIPTEAERRYALMAETWMAGDLPYPKARGGYSPLSGDPRGALAGMGIGATGGDGALGRASGPDQWAEAFDGFPYLSREHMQYYGRQVTTQDGYINNVKGVMASLFERQAASIIGKMKNLPADETPSLAELRRIYDSPRWTKETRTALAKELEAVVGDATKRVDEMAAKDVGRRGYNAEHIRSTPGTTKLSGFIRQQSQGAGGAITGTTWEKLRNELAKGIDKGEKIPELAGRVEKVMGTRMKSSPETIARTEVLSAWNRAQYIRAEQLGAKSKKWVTQADERVRKTHLPLHDDEPIPLRQDFNVGSATGPGPHQMSEAGENINCRCTLVYGTFALPAEEPTEAYAEEPIVGAEQAFDRDDEKWDLGTTFAQDDDFGKGGQLGATLFMYPTKYSGDNWQALAANKELPEGTGDLGLTQPGRFANREWAAALRRWDEQGRNGPPPQALAVRIKADAIMTIGDLADIAPKTYRNKRHKLVAWAIKNKKCDVILENNGKYTVIGPDILQGSDRIMPVGYVDPGTGQLRTKPITDPKALSINNSMQVRMNFPDEDSLTATYDYFTSDGRKFTADHYDRNVMLVDRDDPTKPPFNDKVGSAAYETFELTTRTGDPGGDIGWAGPDGWESVSSEDRRYLEAHFPGLIEEVVREGVSVTINPRKFADSWDEYNGWKERKPDKPDLGPKKKPPPEPVVETKPEPTPERKPKPDPDLDKELSSILKGGPIMTMPNGTVVIRNAANDTFMVMKEDGTTPDIGKGRLLRVGPDRWAIRSMKGDGREHHFKGPEVTALLREQEGLAVDPPLYEFAGRKDAINIAHEFRIDVPNRNIPTVGAIFTDNGRWVFEHVEGKTAGRSDDLRWDATEETWVVIGDSEHGNADDDGRESKRIDSYLTRQISADIAGYSEPLLDQWLADLEAERVGFPEPTPPVYVVPGIDPLPDDHRLKRFTEEQLSGAFRELMAGEHPQVVKETYPELDEMWESRFAAATLFTNVKSGGKDERPFYFVQARDVGGRGFGRPKPGANFRYGDEERRVMGYDGAAGYIFDTQHKLIGYAYDAERTTIIEMLDGRVLRTNQSSWLNKGSLPNDQAMVPFHGSENENVLAVYDIFKESDPDVSAPKAEKIRKAVLKEFRSLGPKIERVTRGIFSQENSSYWTSQGVARQREWSTWLEGARQYQSEKYAAMMGAPRLPSRMEQPRGERDLVSLLKRETSSEGVAYRWFNRMMELYDTPLHRQGFGKHTRKSTKFMQAKRGSHFSPANNEVHIARPYSPACITHEMGHWLEHMDSDDEGTGISKYTSRFLAQRALKYAADQRYLEGEKGTDEHLEDEFLDRYVGRSYEQTLYGGTGIDWDVVGDFEPGEEQIEFVAEMFRDSFSATEVFSRGVEDQYQNVWWFAIRDPDHFNMISSMWGKWTMRFWK